MSKVIAILVADLHLQTTPPPARAGGDWWQQMADSLGQVNALAKLYECPVIAAGDIFNKWDADGNSASARLITFAMQHLAGWYVLPGQHDLPHHRYDLIEKSAYWTCAATAGGFFNLEKDGVYDLPGGLTVYPFPWGCEVTPPENPKGGRVHLAVIHAYVWGKADDAYPDAPADAQLPAWRTRLAGYTAAVFGDNHRPCEGRTGGCLAFNPGSLMRRYTDQADHKPSVGLLRADGTITRHYLSTAGESFAVCLGGGVVPYLAAAVAADPALAEFTRSLGDLGEGGLDFTAALLRHLETCAPSPAAKALLLAALGR